MEKAYISEGLAQNDLADSRQFEANIGATGSKNDTGLTQARFLSVPEIQRALRVKRFTEPMAVRPFISGLIEQIGNWEHRDVRDHLRRMIEANILAIEAARQGE